MASTMKAVRIHEFGSEDVLRYEDVPVPAFGPNEVLIKVRGTSVNPVDWKIRSGQLAMHARNLPKILGSDVSGTVVATGALVTRFRIGDAVITRTEGAYAQFVVAKTDVVAAAPRQIPLEQAAGIPVAGCVAWSVLFDVAVLRPQQKILIHAGAGGVGSFAVQLARLAGAHVIATASGRNRDLVMSLGAHEVIDYQNEDFAVKARDLDVVFDTIGGDTQARSWRVLRRGGVLASILSKPDEELAKQYGVSAFFTRRDPNGAMLQELAQLVDSGRLKVLSESQFPIAQVGSAHALSATGRARGKIILIVD